MYLEVHIFGTKFDKFYVKIENTRTLYIPISLFYIYYNMYYTHTYLLQQALH